MIYNLIVSVYTKNLLGLSPILIQAIVLYLLISKNKYVQLLVKIWSGIFLIGSGGLVAIGILLQFIGRGKEELFSTKFIIHIVFVLIGILVFTLINDLGKVEEELKKI